VTSVTRVTRETVCVGAVVTGAGVVVVVVEGMDVVGVVVGVVACAVAVSVGVELVVEVVVAVGVEVVDVVVAVVVTAGDSSGVELDGLGVGTGVVEAFGMSWLSEELTVLALLISLKSP
jgi:hypothetical protein